MRILLNEAWKMRFSKSGNEILESGNLPVSVYQTLLRNEKMDDPYYGENEYATQNIALEDYDFIKEFYAPNELLENDRVIIRFFGIDTLGEIYLNDKLVGAVNNMHRTYEFEVKNLLVPEKNKLEIKLKSPLKYISEKQEKRPLWGVDSTVAGFPYLRKGHFMFGWDWGPQIPDLGIWKDAELIGINGGRIDDVYAVQHFDSDYKHLKLEIKSSYTVWKNNLTVSVKLALSDGRNFFFEKNLDSETVVNHVFEIESPPLWFVRGYGEQNLQNLEIDLIHDNVIVDSRKLKLGFRSLTVNRGDDNSRFCFNCNGIDIFAMGANFIPQDQILPRINEQRTKKFFSDCIEANYNTIRVWGGGLYPDDVFLEECDRLGLILWQDFMFACAAYLVDDEFEATIKAEFKDNINRIKNHACLGLWCGNNEIESAWEGWGLPDDKEAKADYIRIFEEIIPQALKQYDPETFYWPSSPSNGGNQYGEEGVFKNSGAVDKGDQHYWNIWHNFAPLEEFRKHLFPFCSEYGFESIPDIKTIRSFAEEADLNLCSPVMENHQKCKAGNEKLLYYVAQMCRYPYDFESLVYATQLVQSDAIRSDVEHMRRNRGKCMGSLYWQVNDSNPVISWSSIDYYGRYKALHYNARKFYAPVLISCLEEDISAVKLNVSNEQVYSVTGIVRWSVCLNTGRVFWSGEKEVNIDALSSLECLSLDLTDYLGTRENKRKYYLKYSFEIDKNVVSKGTAIFVRPKEFSFINPEIKADVAEESSFSVSVTFIDGVAHPVNNSASNEDYIKLTLTASAFAKSVCLSLKDSDVIFSDNWFDINGKEAVTIKIPKGELTADEVRKQLRVRSCYDI